MSLRKAAWIAAGAAVAALVSQVPSLGQLRRMDLAAAAKEVVS